MFGVAGENTCKGGNSCWVAWPLLNLGVARRKTETSNVGSGLG
jgi:hypothetical protein